jgi:hypothetical protein
MSVPGVRRLAPWILPGLAVVVVAVFFASFEDSDLRTVTIDIPGLDDDRAERIMTNAALNETACEFAGPRHACEVDVPRRIVLYHEGPQLLRLDYLARIQQQLKDVGFCSRILSVQHNPDPPLEIAPGIFVPGTEWLDRFTAVIEIAEMTTNTSANVALSAIGRARHAGGEDALETDRRARTMTVRYRSMLLCLSDIEHAIACAGFSANDTPANLGRDDAPPYHWRPVDLGQRSRHPLSRERFYSM